MIALKVCHARHNDEKHNLHLKLLLVLERFFL